MSYIDNIKNIPIVIRGAGDLATGVAVRLFRGGFPVIMTDIEKPTVIRRTVAFAQAIYDGETAVEGISAKSVAPENALNTARSGKVAVCIDPQCSIIGIVKPIVLVDAILAKKNLGTNKNMAPFTIGLGPGFNAGYDVHAVVETQRGHKLGTVIYNGYAQGNTGIPAKINGYGVERVIRSTCAGIFKGAVEIGDIVRENDVVAFVGNTPIYTKIAGKVRGLLHDDLFVPADFKVADVDPRGEAADHTTCSDKARAVAGGVLEAILHFLTTSA